MHPHRSQQSSAFFLMAILASCSSRPAAARAELIASESFDYPAGKPLSGARGGTGWDGPWFVSPLVQKDNRVVSPTM